MKENSKELDSMMHVICFNTTSRRLTSVAREALVNLIMKNCKYEQVNWAEKMLKTDAYARLLEVARARQRVRSRWRLLRRSRVQRQADAHFN